jgi:hypothetical protein
MTTADVIALFPRCSVCGQPLELPDAELDPNHVFRVKHAACVSVRGAA